MSLQEFFRRLRLSPTILLAALLGVPGLLFLNSCLGSPTGGGTGVEGVTGTLVDPAGAPVAGAWVKIFTPSDSSSGAVLAKTGMDASRTVTDAGAAYAPDSVQTSASGKFRFLGVANGTYNVSASAQRGDTALSLLLRGVIVNGNTVLGIDTLRVSGSITMQVQSGSTAVQGAQCFIPGTPYAGVSNAQGQCVLAGIPPGTFELVISYQGHAVGVTGELQVLSNLITSGGVLDLLGGGIQPPETPVPVSPVSISPAKATSGNLVWNSSARALSYHVQLATDSTFASVVANDSSVAGTTRAYGPLAAGTTHYWRVRAKNPGGASSWSTVSRFRTTGIAVVSAKLVAHYDFEEGAGTTLSDRTGKGHNGTITGSALWATDGITGSSLHFSGSNHVTIPGSADFSSLRSFTLSAWVWQDDLANDRPILEFGEPSAYSSVHLWTNSDGTTVPLAGAVYVNLRAGGHPSYRMNTVEGLAPASQWNQLTLTFDSATRIGRIFVNGVQSASYTMPVGVNPSLAGSLYLGFRPSSSLDWLAGYDFRGRMDEVRIYDGPLSGTQVDSLYRAMAPQASATYFGINASTVALWTFNDATGGVYADASGHGYNLSAPSAATLSVSPSGKSATFNGSVASSSNPAIMIEGQDLITYDVRLWMDSYPSSSEFNGVVQILGSYAGVVLTVGYNGFIQVGAQIGGGSSWNWFGGTSSSGVIPLGQWVTVTVSGDRLNGKVYAFINGVPLQLYNDVARTGVLRSDYPAPFLIGGTQSGQYFLGKIDEVRASNTLVQGVGLPTIIDASKMRTPP
jgi:hypothetical protein